MRGGRESVGSIEDATAGSVEDDITSILGIFGGAEVFLWSIVVSRSRSGKYSPGLYLMSVHVTVPFLSCGLNEALHWLSSWKGHGKVSLSR